MIVEFFRSPVAVGALIAWLLAQGLKAPIEYLRHRKWDWALLISAGGMPSSHSALMSAVAVGIGLESGWGSPLFVLALAIAAVVIYDATGVRRQAGLHAERINLIIKEIFENKNWPESELKSLAEVIGHSPGEALAGVLFGTGVAILTRWLMT